MAKGWPRGRPAADRSGRSTAEGVHDGERTAHLRGAGAGQQSCARTLAQRRTSRERAEPGCALVGARRHTASCAVWSRRRAIGGGGRRPRSRRDAVKPETVGVFGNAAGHSWPGRTARSRSRAGACPAVPAMCGCWDGFEAEGLPAVGGARHRGGASYRRAGGTPSPSGAPGAAGRQRVRPSGAPGRGAPTAPSSGGPYRRGHHRRWRDRPSRQTMTDVYQATTPRAFQISTTTANISYLCVPPFRRSHTASLTTTPAAPAAETSLAHMMELGLVLPPCQRDPLPVAALRDRPAPAHDTQRRPRRVTHRILPCAGIISLRVTAGPGRQEARLASRRRLRRRGVFGVEGIPETRRPGLRGMVAVHQGRERRRRARVQGYPFRSAGLGARVQGRREGVRRVGGGARGLGAGAVPKPPLPTKAAARSASGGLHGLGAADPQRDDSGTATRRRRWRRRR